MNRDLDYYLVQLRRIEDHREAGAEKTIRKIYKRLLKELKEFIAVQYVNYAENDVLTYAMLQQKGVYARFLEEVTQRINTLTPQASEEILRVVEEIYSMAYSGMVEATEKSSTTTELREALSGLKGTTPEVVRRAVENPVSGLTLKDTLEKHRREIIYDIKRNISVGLMNGDRMSTVAKRISESVDQDYRKAMTITRTETQRVREAGHLDAAKDLDEHLRKAGFCQAKIWRTKQDERVRPGRGIGKKKSRNGANHVRMQGVTLPVNEYFDLGRGVKTLAPGQSGDAKNDINCRCRLSYRTVPIDKVEKTDILKENKIKPIPITDDAIEKVPIVKSALLSDEQNEVLREKHRELLRFVQNEKPGIEAIAYLDRNLNLIDRHLGGTGHVKGIERTNGNIVIHNHPSGDSFSYNDIYNFVAWGDLNILTAVGNNGTCYLVEKLIDYNASGFLRLFKEAGLKYPHFKENYQEHKKFMDYIMKGALKYGVRFN